jgi:hypothetical protein
MMGRAHSRRRTAGNGFLLDEVGDLSMAGDPELTAEGRWVMPVIASNARRRPIGQVGFISVDAATGSVLFSEADRAQTPSAPGARESAPSSA